MINTLISRKCTKEIALALGELNEDVVFVGGAIVSMYIDDPSAEDVRPTKDIDITFDISSYSELELIREKLNEKGFIQSHEDDVICRFRFGEIKVDVMSTHPVGWAPANKWFKTGFYKAEKIVIENQPINILPLPYFLATKFAAFFDRGIEDPIISKDFEDIVYLLSYCSNWVEQIKKINDEQLMEYLKESCSTIIMEQRLQDAILAHIFYELQMERFAMIKEQITELCKS